METKKSTKKPADKPTAPVKADITKVSVEGIPPETIEAVLHCVKNGYHNKLRKVVASLPDDHPFKIEAIKQADDLDATAKAKKNIAAKKRFKKEVSSENVVDKYTELYDLLTEFELQERMKGKPFRHAVVSRRRVEVFRDNFKRNCR